MSAQAKRHPARRAFVQALQSRPFDLLEAVACIAWEDQDFDQRAWVHAEIDAYVTALRPRMAAVVADSVVARLDAQVDLLHQFFFVELGYHGTEHDYYSVQHSYIDYVMRTQRGLPILLSLIYLVVAERLELPVAGVAFPGHFMVQFRQPGMSPIIVDPFRGGRRWGLADCANYLVSQGSGHDVQSWLLPPTGAYTVTRILRNLKSGYVMQGDYERAAATLERMLLIDSRALNEMRDYGLILGKLGYANQALAYLELYARLNPQAPDLETIKYHASSLVPTSARTN
jgi:regulator of sirC expression with transglutaminase-like and TPR domain